jgi:hypothetical protein
MPIVFGNSNLVGEYRRQLEELGKCGASLGGGKGVPTIVGEIGIPFDFNDGAAYTTGDFNLQISGACFQLSHPTTHSHTRRERGRRREMPLGVPRVCA